MTLLVDGKYSTRMKNISDPGVHKYNGFVILIRVWKCSMTIHWSDMETVNVTLLFIYHFYISIPGNIVRNIEPQWDILEQYGSLLNFNCIIEWSFVKIWKINKC